MSERATLQNLKDKSEDDYEKNITYLSAGALALSTTLLSNIVDINRSQHFWLVIASWCLLAATLISNLASHLYSSYVMDLCINDEDAGYEVALSNWRRRTKKIRIWNIFNIAGLFGGISLFVIFVSINIPNTNDGPSQRANDVNNVIPSRADSLSQNSLPLLNHKFSIKPSAHGKDTNSATTKARHAR